MKPENQPYYQMRITSLEYAMKENFANQNSLSQKEEITPEKIVSDADKFFEYITKDDKNPQPVIKSIVN